MRTDVDGAAFDRWLWREAERYWGGEEEETLCATCEGNGWVYTASSDGEDYIKDGCPDCAPFLGEDTTDDEARADHRV